MKAFLLLLFAVLQSSPDGPNSGVDAREESGAGSVPVVPLSELRQLTSSGDYVAVPREMLPKLRQESGESLLPDEALKRPQIRNARYSATLIGTRLEKGLLDLEMYQDSVGRNAGPLLIGAINLQQLQLSDNQGAVSLGADSSRRLFVLRPGLPEKLSGTWAADGLVAGDVITFRLELPAATTSQIELFTPQKMVVASTGSLVLGPEQVGDQLKWILIPGDVSRLSLSCRTQPDLSTLGTLPLTGFSANHAVSSDTLSSRWTMGLPSGMNRTVVLTARVSENIRISEVVLEDNRPVEWSATLENRKQIVRMVVPASFPTATLTISANSLLPQAETWNLPMLSPLQWQTEDGQYRGQILTPVSQINVLVPAVVELDEWILVGIQERDVVTRPDQSREYQLTQFLPEASAVVRTSNSQPRITDAVVTLVEPAGRLVTVRCFINIRCEGAAVVQLKWPVNTGWQVIAARYASNGRALFFEFPDARPDATTVPLTVHLPESLEPGASRVIEVQLQQSDSLELTTPGMPLQIGSNVERSSSFVVFPPAFSLNSDLQRRWSSGRRTLSAEEMRRQAPWFPESIFLPGMQAFGSADNVAFLNPAISSVDSGKDRSIRLEHAIRIADGLIVENSRIVLPADVNPSASLSLLVPSSVSGELRWSVDGEPVAAKREENSEVDADWRRWTIPVVNRRTGLPCVIRSESRRAMTSVFHAAIPQPETTSGLDGTLQLFSTEEGLLSVPRLLQSMSSDSDSSFTTWRLPAEPELIQVTVDQNSGIQSGQTIDVHMLHLIGEQNGGLQRDILAVANVSRSAGQNVLSLSLEKDIRPLVLVNGHRVQLKETSEGLAIPLPPSSADCQVLLTWSESGEHPDKIIGERQLPRLFVSQATVPQCTHHILMEPGLELQTPLSSFSAAEPTEIARVLDRLLVSSSNGDFSSQLSDVQSIPSDVRRFIIRWRLAVLQGWQPRTLIDSVIAEKPIRIQITQLRRRLAIMAGTMLLLIAACIGLRSFLIRYRLVVATNGLAVLGISAFVKSQILSAVLQGIFWGTSIGLLLVMLSRWRWLKIPGRKLFLRPTLVSLVWISLSSLCSAVPQTNPSAAPNGNSEASLVPADTDFLVPENPGSDSEVVYVRRRLLDAWKSRESARQALAPAAVVTSLHSRVVAESADSIELHLMLGVAAVSSDEETMLRIPLQGSRLVECHLDGEKVFPESDGADAIRVAIPASTLVALQPLDLAKAGDTAVGDGVPNTAVDAGSLAAFTVHQIECRLRPLTSRQTSGVQFRLPGLPCPAATVEVVAPSDLYSSARAQTSHGVVQWIPSEGIVGLNSLAMSDGIDLRLFQAGLEKGSPQPSIVKMLAINETLFGQQILSCVCRFSRWNQLAPEVRYRVPQGYRLTAVSATTGADVVTDLLWSVKEQNAVVQLPAGVGNEFVLSLQLVCQTPAVVQNQPVPIAELQQFADCVVSPELLLAVRANAVFSVLQLEGERVSTVFFQDLQADWGQWLKRTDIVFKVPGGLPTCVVRLAPRNSVNEVRIAQNVAIQESQIEWKFQVDVATSVLPVFRHRLKISSDIVVTDVQVVAGEANRLDSWHRRGDQLVIQLKEGTLGLHGITITGRQILRPDDSTLTLHSLHLENKEFPESRMTIVDQDGLGLTFVKLGGAAPDDRIESGDALPPGVSISMQITNEADPIVLQRIRPVDPVASVAAFRTRDEIIFVMQISKWSAGLGPLHMTFPDNAAFLLEPFVVVEGRQMPLLREENQFVADQDVVKALFDRPDFTVVWSMPIQMNDVTDVAATFAWPGIFDGLKWSDLLLVPLDADPTATEPAANRIDVPEWAAAGALSAGKDVSGNKREAIKLPATSLSTDSGFTIPVGNRSDIKGAETGRDVIALSDTIVWTSYEQSPVGETVLVLFAAKTPSKCSIQIPPENVVTELEADESTRWEDSDRRAILMELSRPVTIVRLRWLSQRADGATMASKLRLLPPFPNRCTVRRTLTVVSEDGAHPQFAGSSVPLSAASLMNAQLEEIEAGLGYARVSETQSSGRVFDSLPTKDSLLQAIVDSRSEFLRSYHATGRHGRSTASCRSQETGSILVNIPRRAGPMMVFSLMTGVFVFLIAAAAKNRTVETTVLQPDLSVKRQAGNSRSAAAASGDSAGTTLSTLPAKEETERVSANAAERAPSSISQTPSGHT